METGREKFSRNKSTILLISKVFGLLGKRVNKFLLTFFRNTNGKLGLLIRYTLIKNICKTCGDNVAIYPNVFLFNLEELSLGSNVSIHPMCYIDAIGGIEIGNYVSIAHGSSILSTNHSWHNPSIPIKYNEQNFSKVIIEDDVWIGCGCRILAGSKIGKRSIVAAGAVTNKDVLSQTIVGGVPAKKIKNI